MDKYNFNFRTLIGWLLPSFMRKTRMIAWLYAVVKVLRDLHATFIAFGGQKFDEIKYNGQTIKLRNLLVSTYGAGITITNNINTNVDIYLAYEANDPQNEHAFEAGSSGNGFVFEADTIPLGQADFTINIPAAITYDEDELRALVNKYKLYGKTFDIAII